MNESEKFLDTGNSKSNLQDYSVSEISAALKKTVEDRFGHVRIRGEITGYRGRHASGHCYFAMKDERARIEAVIWKGNFNRLKHKPEEGLEVIASGKLTTYPGSSKYQIVIDSIEPAGVGALMALLEERRTKLEAEGLFATERKQLLPFMPRRIGVVTSPTGSVIRDILHRLTDRFPLHVIVWPVRVQGETTGAEVSNGIRGFNAMAEEQRPDVIIVARGGGSIEDLWGFNDEAVVRAAAASDIPLVSAVGHETDWTLLDYAADVRAPTPTGAAEMTVPVKADLAATVASYHARLKSALTRRVDQARSNLRAAVRGLSGPDSLLAMPRRSLDEARGRLGRGLDFAARSKRAAYERVATQLTSRGLSAAIALNRERIDAAERRVALAHGNMLATVKNRNEQILYRLPRAFSAFTRTKSQRFGQASRLLQSLSYKSVLQRGFAVVRDANGKPVRGSALVKPGAAFSAELHDGIIHGVAAGTGKQPPVKKQPKPQTPEKQQGDLF